MEEGITHPPPLSQRTYKATLLPNRGDNTGHAIGQRGDAAGELPFQHRQIVQMVAHREHLRAIQPKRPGNFRKRGSLVVCLVTEPCINIVPHHRQSGHFFAIIFQPGVDFIHVGIVFGDDA